MTKMSFFLFSRFLIFIFCIESYIKNRKRHVNTNDALCVCRTYAFFVEKKNKNKCTGFLVLPHHTRSC